MFFLFGSTPGLSDLLSVSHEHVTFWLWGLHVNSQSCVCISISELDREPSDQPSMLTWKDYRKILCRNYFSTSLHRSEFSGCLIEGFCETCTAEPTINQHSGARFDDKDLTAVRTPWASHSCNCHQIPPRSLTGHAGVAQPSLRRHRHTHPPCHQLSPAGSQVHFLEQQQLYSWSILQVSSWNVCLDFSFSWSTICNSNAAHQIQTDLFSVLCQTLFYSPGNVSVAANMTSPVDSSIFMLSHEQQTTTPPWVCSTTWSRRRHLW